MKWLTVLVVATGCQGTQRPLEVAKANPAPSAEPQVLPSATVASEPAPLEPAPAASSTIIADAEITRIDEHTFRVSRAAFERLLADPSPLERGARIVPAFVDGKQAGMRLYGIRPGTLDVPNRAVPHSPGTITLTE